MLHEHYLLKLFVLFDMLCFMYYDNDDDAGKICRAS